uniref:Secreted protein n=1 Tax=Bursaphelenchus xylophilus TaxID=6326 RepID=A0A1I7SNK4_BURXY
SWHYASSWLIFLFLASEMFVAWSSASSLGFRGLRFCSKRVIVEGLPASIFCFGVSDSYPVRSTPYGTASVAV